jgi:hypothetical protein
LYEPKINAQIRQKLNIYGLSEVVMNYMCKWTLTCIKNELYIHFYVSVLIQSDWRKKCMSIKKNMGRPRAMRTELFLMEFRNKQ